MDEHIFQGRHWNLQEKDGSIGTWQKVEIAVLMDIRRELVQLNTLLACPNFRDIPNKLDKIQRNTKKPTRRQT